MKITAYQFVIHTDSYSGNFERKLCAACTGQFGECGVGEEIAEAFKAKYPAEWKQFGKIIRQVADEHGVKRPTEIWPTPGFFNDGMGTQWPEGTDPNLVHEKYMQSMHNYYDPLIIAARDHIAAGRVEWKTSLDSYERTMAQAAPGHFAAYLSVAIHFKKPPTDELIAFMKQRAAEFAEAPQDDYVKPFNIIGFEAEITKSVTEKVSL